jgi:lactoylglutathione lyase
VVDFLHIWYSISNIERSLRFYEALGFEERRRVPVGDKRLNIVLGLPTEEVPRLVLMYEEGVDEYDLGDGYGHIMLGVRDLESTLRRLAQAGIHPDDPVSRPGGPEGYPQCGFRDPDGYWVGLMGDRDNPPAARNAEATGSGGSQTKEEGPRSRHQQSTPENPELDPHVEALIAEEAERRKKALDPATNRVLPRNPEIGREGVEALWNEWRPRYPMVRHKGKTDKGDEDPPLRVRVPPEKDIGKWLRNGRHNLPKLIKQGSWWWELPFEWLDEITAQLADKYGGVLVIRDEASVENEKCAGACVKAESPVTSCKCSCGGRYHGIGALPVGFHVINETLAVRTSKTEGVSITFIKPRSASERQRMDLR